jgi:serine/threonine protein kinase
MRTIQYEQRSEKIQTKTNALNSFFTTENILVNDQEENNIACIIIKLADFARFGHRLGYSTAGTLYYRAPELIVGSRCCHYVNLWARGCLLFEVATSKLLFPVPGGDYTARSAQNRLATIRLPNAGPTAGLKSAKGRRS